MVGQTIPEATITMTGKSAAMLETAASGSPGRAGVDGGRELGLWI
ncbi:hypothetical protein [Micromonospora sp. KLBMP9576]